MQLSEVSGGAVRSVSAEQQTKKGVRRFLEVLFGEFWGLVRLNLLFFACVIPSAVLFLLGLFGINSAAVLPLSLVAAYPAGGAVTAVIFVVTRLLRDEPGYIWSDFKRKFIENHKQAAVPGILCAAFVYGQVFLWGGVAFGGLGVSSVYFIPMGIALLLFSMITPFIFVQIAYLRIATKRIIINSIILAFTHIVRSAAGAVFGGAVWAAVFMYLPSSLAATPVIILIGVSFSALLNMMWVWPPVNKRFSIEKTLIERREETDNS